MKYVIITLLMIFSVTSCEESEVEKKSRVEAKKVETARREAEQKRREEEQKKSSAEAAQRSVEKALGEIRSFGNGVYYIPNIHKDYIDKRATNTKEDTEVIGRVFANFAGQGIEIISIVGDSNKVVYESGYEGYCKAYTIHQGYWVFTKPE